jgi:hypothetical protein
VGSLKKQGKNVAMGSLPSSKSPGQENWASQLGKPNFLEKF